MEEQQTKPTKRSKWTYVLMAWVVLESLSLLDLLITDEAQQMGEIKAMIANQLGDGEGMEYFERFSSRRIGPHHSIELTFFPQNDRQVKARITKWLGFSPRITCVSTEMKGGCQ